ncbi:hypothetical protein [Halorhodospira halochloris]|uniref:hypothetical protein n=1 Tax=Halorhodospira halochloris TaxID=1052 RepID=UPI001EE8F000|nr:hypothetical protein [Halorhodospira halochloris]MCG5547572.1 hypothetical protein [Halorhodospira halochloris]
MTGNRISQRLSSPEVRAVATGLGMALSATASAGIVNGDFGVPERQFVLQSKKDGYQCDISGMCDGQLSNLPGWTFIELGEQFSVVDVSDFEQLSGKGDTVGRFTANNNALTGANDTVAQCIRLDTYDLAGRDFTFKSQITTQFPTKNSFGDHPVELAVKFYEDENCSDEIQEAGLELGELAKKAAEDDNIFYQHFDLALPSTTAASGAETIEIEPWQWGEASLKGQIGGKEPMSAAIFIATGDQMDNSSQTAMPRQLYIDDIQFSIPGVGDGVNLAYNGRFDVLPDDYDSFSDFFSERAPWPYGNQGPFGWNLSDKQSDGEASTETAEKLEFDTVVGDRVFAFHTIDKIDDLDKLMKGRGNDALHQCVDIREFEEGEELSFSASLRSNKGDIDVSYGLIWELYEDYDKCLTRKIDDDSESNNDQSRTGGVFGGIKNADEWEKKSTSSFTMGKGDRYARLIIQVAGWKGYDEDDDLSVYVDHAHIASLSESEDPLDDDDAPDSGSDDPVNEYDRRGCGDCPPGCSTGSLSDPALPVIALLALLALLKSHQRSVTLAGQIARRRGDRPTYRGRLR